ncbi:MAG TPA: AMP-binding protein [Acidimicrobiales bacterium]|nr:AMP-binding protein [Acidimicrobiales bacterium]
MNLTMLADLPSMIVPEGTALVDAEGPIDYETLRARVAGTAGLLAGLGVGPGDRVGILSTNRAAVVEALFATAALGATVVPMNYRAKPDELRHLLADSGARVLFAEQRYAGDVAAVRPASLAEVVVLDDADGYPAARDAAEPDLDIADVDDDEVAILLYTSGTTSMPKGVMLTHGALTGYVMGANDAADGTTEGTSLLSAPLYHVAGVTSLLNALYTGRPTVLLPQFEPAAWLAAVAEHRVTHAFLVPTMLARLLEDPALERADLSSLEQVTYGAAPMPAPVIRRALERFPSSVRWSGAYGQTETTATVAVLGPDDHDLSGDPAEVEAKLARLASVGRPLEDVELRVVDPDGNPLGPGEVGEVQLRTFRSMRGYWGAEEKTRVTVDDEGWVHTGDVGHLDADGYLFLTGRAGDLIIRGGENVAPAEVEAVLYEHPDVLEAGVVGMPDETWGERVAAVVALREGAAATAEDLVAFCAGRLASFKRPERVVVVDELPRTSTGKVVRRDLTGLVGQ